MSSSSSSSSFRSSLSPSSHLHFPLETATLRPPGYPTSTSSGFLLPGCHSFRPLSELLSSSLLPLPPSQQLPSLISLSSPQHRHHPSSNPSSAYQHWVNPREALPSSSTSVSSSSSSSSSSPPSSSSTTTTTTTTATVSFTAAHLSNLNGEISDGTREIKLEVKFNVGFKVSHSPNGDLQLSASATVNLPLGSTPESKRRRQSTHAETAKRQRIERGLALPSSSTSSEICLFELLPDEIVLRIFSFLTAFELGRYSTVCQSWNKLLEDSQLWKPLCFYDFAKYEQEKVILFYRRPYRFIRDPAAPKRNLSAYLLFCQDTRPIVRRDFPDLGFADITKQLAQRWRDLSSAERTNYSGRSLQDKARFEKELKEYLRRKTQGNEEEIAASGYKQQYKAKLEERRLQLLRLQEQLGQNEKIEQPPKVATSYQFFAVVRGVLGTR